MARLLYALWPAGLVFGMVAEWIGQPHLIVLDSAAGFALLFLGLTAWRTRPETRAGPIMAGAGFAWFLGTLWAPAVFLNRGALAHLLISYPSGRLSTRLELAAVGAAYGYAAVYPVAHNDYATIGFAVGLVSVAARRYLTAGGAVRPARIAPLAGATAFAIVLALGAASRLVGAGAGDPLLLAYDVSVLLIAVGLFADLLWGRWTQAAVTGLVVDLGDTGATGTLRDRLAQTLGDPTLVVAYVLPGEDGYVDEAGRAIELPAPGEARTVTPIGEDGRQMAALIHDVAVLDHPGLISAAASATRLALSNVRLQAEVRARVAEVEASRRRIVEVADEQRHRLERELHEGAEHRLAAVAELLDGSGDALADVRAGLDDALVELRELARGIRPRTLTDRGLRAAIDELAKRSPVPVEAVVPRERFSPAVEATIYFVCSEALANVAKYADASLATIDITAANQHLRVEISDDGAGGAEPEQGSGLRGLSDRVEALGGRFSVQSPAGGGTRILAELPTR
jgi:signal transduction histidine kinase